MKRILWLTDIHLNFLSKRAVSGFLESVSLHKPDVILLGGDTAEAPTLTSYLKRMGQQIQRPIYLVLGNHDFYKGSIDATRAMVEVACGANSFLFWLPITGLVELTPQVGLIGHDGYADGRLGNYEQSDVLMNDYFLIEDFMGWNAEARLKVMQRYADQAAKYIRELLPLALAKYGDVLLLTHVPPFRESCWHQGRISNDNYLPHFSCKAVGDVIMQTMEERPQSRLTVLCGHTHGGGEAQILPNVKVITGDAAYGKPKVNGVFDLD